MWAVLLLYWRLLVMWDLNLGGSGKEEIYFQAEQIDPAGMELETVETAGQEVARTGEEESMEGMDKTCNSVELQKIPGDPQV